MHISDFDYPFSETLIALRPTKERTASRLLCLDKRTQEIAHHQFKNLLDFLTPKDLLVFNDTKVIPARLFAKKATGGNVEVLITQILDETHAQVLLRSSKPVKRDSTLFFDASITARVCEKVEDQFILAFEGVSTLDEMLQIIGHIPLPPYINRQDEAMDHVRYQTVYAKHPGAIAAPTAGLHFDQALLDALEKKGVNKAYITLHVGIGTFQPVRVESIQAHQMHEEMIEVSEATCRRIEETKAQGGRVIAVGTTTVRSLETAAQSGKLAPFFGKTSIFIYPGFKFRVIDALVTNLHVPRSTLLMLVCAFGGQQAVLAAYQEAVLQKYRFFSYGDAMFIS